MFHYVFCRSVNCRTNIAVSFVRRQGAAFQRLAACWLVRYVILYPDSSLKLFDFCPLPGNVQADAAVHPNQKIPTSTFSQLQPDVQDLSEMRHSPWKMTHFYAFESAAFHFRGVQCAR